MNTQRLEDIAAFIVSEARRLGATDCDVAISAHSAAETAVRMGAVEQLESNQGRRLRFRAFAGQKSASTSTSDFARRSLTKMVRDTLVLARASEPDQFAGLPDQKLLATAIADLGLCDDRLGKLTPDRRIALALQAESAALAADKRLTNSEGASFSDRASVAVYANSRGFLGSYRSTACSLQVAVVASEGEQMQVGDWSSSSRHFDRLEDGQVVGRKAAARALGQLGARKVKSQQVPVVFDPRMAGSLLGQFAGAAYGSAIYRNSSFLVGKLGEMVADKSVQIIDDGLMPGALGSRPFDDEGLPTRKRTIVGNGRLESYFLDSYSARKLGTTPNAGGISNLYLQAGSSSPVEIIASVKCGLYLTKVSGPGFNIVTGDYSRGAAGIWIEDGQLAYPVEEITIAGNVLDMFGAIEAIGNDLTFRSSVSAPTIKIGRMMVAGE